MPISVSIPTALHPLRDALHACSSEFPELALLLEETPAGHLQPGQIDLAIDFANRHGTVGFAAQIGSEEILVIVNLDNPVSVMNREQLADIYRGRITRWLEVAGDSLPVQVWNYPSGDGVDEIFSAALLGSDQVTSLAYLAPDPRAMLESVSSDPAAIGYLPRAWLTDQVKSVEIEPQPNDLQNQAIIANAEKEPQGLIRDFLICLQTGAGQTLIAKSYLPWK